MLKKYEGQTIGINYNSPSKISSAVLAKVGDDLFSIIITDDELMKSYPLTSILSIVEGVNGVDNTNTEENSSFAIAVQVYHQSF